MKQPFYSSLICVCAVSLLLVGCGGDVRNHIREHLGLDYQAPDEFSTLVHEKEFKVPDTFDILPPHKVKWRSTGAEIRLQARQALGFEGGNKRIKPVQEAKADGAFLKKFRLQEAEENIRHTLTQEHFQQQQSANKALVFPWQDHQKKEETINPWAEFKRLKEEGKAANIMFPFQALK